MTDKTLSWSGLIFMLFAGPSLAGVCDVERPEPIRPADPAICEALETDIRRPSAFPLDVYEDKLNTFLGAFCHRNPATGWVRDKHLRDTGPATAVFSNGSWQQQYHGTHVPVVIWYSPEMYDWLVTHRGPDAPAQEPAVPAGAVMVKEMFTPPVGECADIDPMRLFPSSGAAIMVRDPQASFDGWFWGWYGFAEESGWAPDWPAGPDNGLPNMGFAQYCLNCHASARGNASFASPRNIEGEPGEPLVFLNQSVGERPQGDSHHEAVASGSPAAAPAAMPHPSLDPKVLADLKAYAATLPRREDIVPMPSQSYDHTWVSAGGPTPADTFLTSSQCLGCHDAGSTGLQFDMTAPNPHGENLENLSPYATWRTSPMGLAGRDPFFFAQLASETQTFHPGAAGLVETTCLGCHGIAGERQQNIDRVAAGDGCQPFTRADLEILPWEQPGQAKYAMLGRDGITCTTCHRMALGDRATAQQAAAPENACVAERQALLNPHLDGFARTFTGSFLVGPPDKLIGPFKEPRSEPMEHALGNVPEHHQTIASSEVCGNCHTVHLPVLSQGQVIGHVYEQTTYPEWAFSDFRTGWSPDGALPSGPGDDPRSCQSCHMPTRDENGVPYSSRIASIQEYSNFPEAEFNLPAEDIDLPVRDGFALHTLVGLNVFLMEMAQQFPDLLGIPSVDPMLGAKGLDPLQRTEQAMVDQARDTTATVSVSNVRMGEEALQATVTIANLAGHKFPSGVGFRRAFVELSVRDAQGMLLWRSGGTNAAGALIDEAGNPLAGEYWWKSDCSARLRPEDRLHQPHYETITSQSQAQIYQELVAAPAGPDAICGVGATPSGPLTTSFLSICSVVKDNRILPAGFLPLDDRIEIAEALGADASLAHEVAATAVGTDPAYQEGGSDTLDYRINLAELAGTPAMVEAKLYYQATPPFYLQDRLCTGSGSDTERLYYMLSHVDLTGTPAQGWKLPVAESGPVAVPEPANAGQQ